MSWAAAVAGAAGAAVDLPTRVGSVDAAEPGA